jgi:hypothetical protein
MFTVRTHSDWKERERVQ